MFHSLQDFWHGADYDHAHTGFTTHKGNLSTFKWILVIEKKSDETQPLFQTRVSDNHEWVGTLKGYVYMYFVIIEMFLWSNRIFIAGLSVSEILPANCW